MNTETINNQQDFEIMSIAKTKNPYCEEGLIALAAAILEDACNDYVKSLKKVKSFMGLDKPTIKDRNDLLTALKEKVRCEQFYRSDWFQVLSMGVCKMSPDELMKEIRLRYGFDE